MPDPGEGDLPLDQLRKVRTPAHPAPRGEPPLPDHFVEERPGVEVIAGGKILE